MDIGGRVCSEHRTAKKKLTNTAIPQKESPNTATLQYRVDLKFRANDTGITIRNLLMNVK